MLENVDLLAKEEVIVLSNITDTLAG